MFKDLRKMKKNSFQSIASNAAKVSHPANLKNHSLDVARLHYTDIWVLYWCWKYLINKNLEFY